MTRSTTVGFVIGFVIVAAGWLGWFYGATRMANPADAAPGSTPPACLEALDMASDGFTASGDALDAARDAVDAARRGDSSGTRRAEDAMAQASARLDDLAPAAGRAAHACRAGR